MHDYDGCDLEPDHRILSDTIELLRSSGYRSLANLHCEIVGDVVVVSGQVRSYYLKQIVQSIILRAGRVKKMKNLVEVREEDRGTFSTELTRVFGSDIG